MRNIFWCWCNMAGSARIVFAPHETETTLPFHLISLLSSSISPLPSAFVCLDSCKTWTAPRKCSCPSTPTRLPTLPWSTRRLAIVTLSSPLGSRRVSGCCPWSTGNAASGSPERGGATASTKWVLRFGGGGKGGARLCGCVSPG